MRAHRALPLLLVATACSASVRRAPAPSPTQDPWIAIPLTPEERSRAAVQTHSTPAPSVASAPTAPCPTPPPEPPAGDVVLDDPRDDPAPLVHALVDLTVARFHATRCCDDPGAFRCSRQHLEIVIRVEGGRVRRVGVDGTAREHRDLATCLGSALVGQPVSWRGAGASVKERVLLSNPL